MEKILEAKKINKTYMSGKENQQQVLKDIELTVRKGSFSQSWDNQVRESQPYYMPSAGWIALILEVFGLMAWI